MKPAGSSIRWWRIAIWLIAILAVGWLVWPSRTRTSYGAVCARCLQRMHGLEVKRGGIPISNEQTLERFRPDPYGGGGFTLGSMPAVDPKNYEDITGHRCDHDFKRTGYCRYSGRGVGCGQFGEGMAFRPRLEPLEAIFRAFGRIPDRDLGKASLRVLDRIFPADATVQEAHKLSYDFEGTVKNLESMTLLLSVVETPDEWRTALEHFENGFQGEAPLIFDIAFIESRARSLDPLIRRGCAAVISRKQTQASPELLAAMLDDPDDAVSESAGDTVFYSSQFVLFGKLFRKQPPDSYRIDAMGKYGDSDFAMLFGLDDPVVDDTCFEAIAKAQRLRLLDQVVERLNHRDSKAGREAADRLIEGPILGSRDPDSRDPWEWCKAFDGPLDQAVDWVRQGYSRSSDFWSLLKSMKTLAATHDPNHWTIAKRAYEQAADGGISEFHMAIMAKALMDIDPDRTAPFLMNELKQEDHQRLVAALAGMGLIASPIFTNSIEHFQKEPPVASKGNPYSPKYYFENGEPAEVLRCALHRCQRIQDWKLERDSEGRYFIAKPSAR